MNLTDSLQNVLSGAGTLNRYRLDIPSCPSSLDVEDFSGTEGISKIYRYDIIFTSTDRYPDAAWFLRKSATLIMGTGLLESLIEQKKVHGVITDFRRISGSEDQAQYRITLNLSFPCWINSSVHIVFSLINQCLRWWSKS